MAIHHVALAVSDISVAANFYCEVFGAKRLVEPSSIGPPGAGTIVGGPADTSLQLGMVGLPNGPFLEFFKIEGEGAERSNPPRAFPSLPHVGLQVDDLPAALARAEELGGRRLWDEILEVGKAKIMYILDPDGNGIEMVDTHPSSILGNFLERHPESVPSGSDAGDRPTAVVDSSSIAVEQLKRS